MDSSFFQSMSQTALLIYALIALALEFFFIRWAFRINTRVRNQLTMINLLIKLCEKQGVEPSEIEEILTPDPPKFDTSKIEEIFAGRSKTE